MAVLFAAWSVIGVVHAPAAWASAPDIAASANHADHGEDVHLSHSNCSARAHCTSPAIVTADASAAIAGESDWTGTVESAHDATATEPDDPPPNSLPS